MARIITQTLPLLTRSFDWSQLVTHLQGLEPAASVKIYSQLQQLLSSAPGMPAQLKGQITSIVAQLQQVAVSGETTLEHNLLSPAQTPQQPRIENSLQRAPFELSQPFMRLIKNLQEQLSLLPKGVDTPLPKTWYVATRNLLTPLQQAPQLPQLMVPQRQLLETVLNQIRQHPKVSPQLAGEVKRILTQIDRQVAQDLSMPVIKVKPEMVRDPAGIPKQILTQTPSPVDKMPGLKPTDSVVKLSTEIKQLLSQVPQGQEKGPPQGGGAVYGDKTVADPGCTKSRKKTKVSPPNCWGRWKGLLNSLTEVAPGLLPGALPGFGGRG